MSDNGLKEHLKNIAEELHSFMDGFEDPSDKVYKYFDNVLDINYIANSDKSYKGVRLMLTCGGPTIWLDTPMRELQGYWGGGRNRNTIH